MIKRKEKSNDNIFDSLISEKIDKVFDVKMKSLYANYKEQLEEILDSVILKFREEILDEKCAEMIENEIRKSFETYIRTTNSLCETLIKSNDAFANSFDKGFSPRIEKIEAILKSKNLL